MAGAWRLRVALFALLPVLAGCAWITRASVDSSGGDANGTSSAPSLSADGRFVAFVSDASDLVPSDTNGTADVFVRDLLTGTTTRASVDTTGGDPNNQSFAPSMSATGRYVTFASIASDLVPGDGTGGPSTDVFVRDLQNRTTTRVSVDTGGGDPNGFSFGSSISDDGRYVAFDSGASDLVPVDGNGGTGDVFVRDLQTGTTTLVSLDTAGTESSGPSFGPSISADGRYVAFNSEAFDLVPGDGNPYSDIFVRDRQTGITTRASVDIGGGDPNGFSFFPSISDNGRYVAFESGANDLVHGDGTSGTAGVDVFVHDRQTASTTRASVDTTGGDPNSSSRSTDISGGGRFVSFKSDASDLVPADGNSASDVFVRDLQRGATRRVSVDFSGEEANGGSVSPSISDDGRYAAFDSGASDLVGGDGNDLFDTFVRVVDRPTIDSVTPDTIARGTTATLTVTGSGFFPGAQATASAFTENGVTVNSVTVLAETELAVSVSVDADAPTGTRHLAVWNPGTGPGAFATAVGVCAECLTIT